MEFVNATIGSPPFTASTTPLDFVLHKQPRKTTSMEKKVRASHDQEQSSLPKQT
jgi:hypothetical protein